MAIGERIHHFRLLRGFTEMFRATARIQRILADVRIGSMKKVPVVQKRTI